MNQKSFLIILDGWGLAQDKSRSAIDQGKTPFWDKLRVSYPSATLITHGDQVGLPEGQMGNSEVGHLNIGAGRIVYQELARINKSIAENEFSGNAVFQQLIHEAKSKGKKVHLLGLLSDGGVHSHINHIKAVASLLDQAGVPSYLHAFLDGRDTDPHAGQGYVQEMVDHIKDKDVKLATIVGRYFAMDRDKRWDRVKKAYDLLVHGVGKEVRDPIEGIATQYNSGVTDEFMEPMIISGSGEAKIQDGDIVFFVNFRTDRPRQLTHVLSQADMPQHGMKKLNLSFYTMTSYDETFENISVIFEKESLKNTLGEVLAKVNKTQVRIAETEKYPHVTFFFNGGREEPMDGEKRILIPSPNVPTYDLQPEMSAPEITKAIIAEIRKNQPDFICLNFANADMVGHTGDFEAAQKAAECVDESLRQIVETGLEHQYEMIIIADHGNSDYMINDDGSPNTAHTTNPVPVVWVSGHARGKLHDGKLADVAPTLLKLMGIPAPEEMDGKVLID